MLMRHAIAFCAYLFTTLVYYIALFATIFDTSVTTLTFYYWSYIIWCTGCVVSELMLFIIFWELGKGLEDKVQRVSEMTRIGDDE